MGTPRAPFAAVTVLLSALVAAPHASADAWNSVTSQHFSVVGEGSHGRLRSIARTLEQFRLASSRLFPTRATKAERPLTVVVVNRATMGMFAASENIAGFYRRGATHDYIVMRADVEIEQPLQIAIHEYQHLIARATWRSIPRWVNEGLAEFYSTFRETDGGRKYQLGMTLPDRLRALRTYGRARVLDFLADDGRSMSMSDAGRAEDFYSQAWALVHFFTFGDEGRWRDSFGPLVEALAAGEPPAEAFRRIVTPDDHEFDVRFKLYVEGRVFNYLTIEADPVAAARPAEGRLSVAETETLKATLSNDAARARKSLAAARAADPNYLPALALEARQHLFARELESAVAAFATYRRLAPDDLYSCGLAMLALNATKRFEESLAACPATAAPAAVTFERIVALEAVGRAAETGPLRARLVGASDEDLGEMSWRAWRYLEQGHYSAALRGADIAARDRRSPDSVAYNRFIGAVAYALGGEVEAARQNLLQAGMPDGAGRWVHAVFEFLTARIDAAALLARAKGKDELTEARTYAGLVLLAEGKSGEASEQFSWVALHGSRNVSEYYVAMAHHQRVAAGAGRTP